MFLVLCSTIYRDKILNVSSSGPQLLFSSENKTEWIVRTHEKQKNPTYLPKLF